MLFYEKTMLRQLVKCITCHVCSIMQPFSKTNSKLVRWTLCIQSLQIYHCLLAQWVDNLVLDSTERPVQRPSWISTHHDPSNRRAVADYELPVVKVAESGHRKQQTIFISFIPWYAWLGRFFKCSKDFELLEILEYLHIPCVYMSPPVLSLQLLPAWRWNIHIITRVWSFYGRYGALHWRFGSNLGQDTIRPPKEFVQTNLEIRK